MKKILLISSLFLFLVLVTASYVSFNVDVNTNYSLTNGSMIDLEDFGEVGYSVNNVGVNKYNQTWLEFDGVNDKIVIDKVLLDGSSDFSFSFWFNLNNINTFHAFIGSNDTGNYNNYFRFRSDGDIDLNFINLSDSYYKFSGSSITANIDHHIVFVYDGILKSVYIDSVLVGSESATGSINSSGWFNW